MMYGHVETPRQRVEHLIKIRDLQAECPPGRYGFVAFIPWIFRSSGTRLEKEGVDAFFSPLEYLRIIALSRIVLSDIRHIQASWLTVGKQTAQIALHGGADDMGLDHDRGKRRLVGRSPQPARCRRASAARSARRVSRPGCETSSTGSGNRQKFPSFVGLLRQPSSLRTRKKRSNEAGFRRFRNKPDRTRPDLPAPKRG